MTISHRAPTCTALMAALLIALMQSFVPSSARATPITFVTGYGNYCSKTWSTGGSAFGYVSNGGDPCEYIDPQHSGVTQRRGLYASAGLNNVVLRCTEGVWFWTGSGNAPLDWAYRTAYVNTPAKSNCIFTVAPRAMPVFGAPFDLSTPIQPVTGFDFARAPYNTLDVTVFGQVGSKTASKVDFKGRDQSNTLYINDHPGYDWNMSKGTPLKAVADGSVIRAETYHKIDLITQPPCDALETHVYLRHEVCGVNGYCEQFVSYYTHMDSILVSVGQTVRRGDQIGTSGNSGCVSPHLHYTVARLTNTADNLVSTLQFKDQGTDANGRKINVSSNVYNWATDPYGWEPLNGPDPWGWKVYGKGIGAMSIRLWAVGQAPSSGSW